MHHPSPQCVVELRTVKIDPAGNERAGIGSGYLVADGWVLTAAHVVDEVTSVRAWVDPPSTLSLGRESEVDLPGIVRLRGADWALVPLQGYSSPEGFTPAVFGQLDRESTELVPTTAMGLPWYRLRDREPTADSPEPSADQPRLREVLAAGGHVIPAGGGKTGVLTMIVAGAPETGAQTPGEGLATGTRAPDNPQKRSVWEGMSGAAVWAGRVLVGVVTRHELLEGPTALSVDPLPSEVDDDVGVIMPGLSDPVVVRDLVGRIERMYRQIAADLAPSVLTERFDEITAMDEFAQGTSQWWWWSADAFAGKTALTAWWVAYNTDPDVAVVACFLSRTARHDTADYLVRTWAKQLGAIAESPDLSQLGQLTADPEGRTQLQALINDAARQQKRLILVVDGLDEHATAGSIPVRQWLPKPERLPANAALLVTSRAGAPDGIPPGHPLHDHQHHLDSSAVAERLRIIAEEEIELVVESPTATRERRILGYLVAAAAPLTIHELTSLISMEGGQVTPSDIGAVWHASLSRILAGGPASSSELRFSHDALRASAAEGLAGDRPICRAILDRWADGYRADRWPSDTPQYLLRGYPAMLAADPDTDRLYEIATSSGRWMRLFLQDGSPIPANAEIQQAQLSVAQQSSDGGQGSELRILTLGLFRSPVRQSVTIAARSAVAVWAACSDYDRAIRLAQVIREPDARFAALSDVAVAAVLNQDTIQTQQLFDDALAAAAPSGTYGDQILTDFATRLANAGAGTLAEDAARKITKPLERLLCFARMSRGAAHNGQIQVARALIATVQELATDPSYPDRHRSLAVLAETLMILGDDDEAMRVLEKAKALTGSAQFSDEGKYRWWADIVVSTGRYRCQAVSAARRSDNLIAAMQTDSQMEVWLRTGQFSSQRASWYVANVAAALTDANGVGEQALDLARMALRRSISSTNPNDEEARWVESTHLDLARLLMTSGLVDPLISALDDVERGTTFTTQAWQEDCKLVRGLVVRHIAASGDWTRAEHLATTPGYQESGPSGAQIAAAAAPALRATAAWTDFQQHALIVVEKELRDAVTRDREERLALAAAMATNQVDVARTRSDDTLQSTKPAEAEVRAETESVLIALAHEIAGIDFDRYEHRQFTKHIEHSLSEDASQGRQPGTWIDSLPLLAERAWGLSEDSGVHPDCWLRSMNSVVGLLQRLGATDTARSLATSMLEKLQSITDAGVLQSCVGPTLQAMQRSRCLTDDRAAKVLACVRAATATASLFEMARIGSELATASNGGPPSLAQASVDCLLTNVESGAPFFATWYRAAESALCSLVDGGHADLGRRLAEVLLQHAASPNTMWYDQAAIYSGIARSEEPTTAKVALRNLAMHDAFLDFIDRLPTRVLAELVSSGAFETPSA